MTSRRVDGRGWGWYSVDVELRVTGLWQRREYVQRRQAKIEEYVEGKTI